MKKIVALIIMLFTATFLAQSPDWTTLKETNITVGANDYDIFTNGDGNHIIVRETNALKYYKMDVNGNTVINLNPPLESTTVTSPSISGDLTRIFAVYRKNTENNIIRTKISSNGGVSWSYISNLSTPEGNASSIECIFSKGILHVTFLVGTTVYYNYFDTNLQPPNWLTTNITISDPQIPSAANPRICINNTGSTDTVYFTFNEVSGWNNLKWRRYIVGGTLQDLNQISHGLGLLPENIGFAVDNEYLYAFWKNSNTSQFQWTVRRIWDNYFIPQTGTSNGNTYVDKIFSTATVDNNLFTAAWSTLTTFSNSIVRMYCHYPPGFEYVLINTQTGLSPVNVVNLSSAGNDIHVVWKDNLGTNNGNNLRYKYYDDYPISPQNISISSYSEGSNSYPKLEWELSNDPDVRLNSTDGFIIERRTRIIRQSWSLWHLVGSSSGLATQFIDYTIATAGSGAEEAEYRIRAKDVGNHYSQYSSSVSIIFGMGQSEKMNSGLQKFSFTLDQNYPNPFNPTTTINYSIQNSSLVTLTVYDMLGVEVAELVYEHQEAGIYSIEFNAANLPSGMYIYKLTSGKYTETKKLILLK